MSDVKLSKQQKAALVASIQDYFKSQLDSEIGGFDAEFLLDFFEKELGGYFYNQAIADVHSVLEKHSENISDALYQLEKPTPADR